MKIKKMFALMAMLVMSLTLFTACSSDDDEVSGGISGYYVSTKTSTSGGVTFKNAIIISGSTLYKGFVCDKIYNYGGNDMRSCSWYSGWYCVPEKGSDLWSSTSFTCEEGVIVCDNGNVFIVSNGQLTNGSEVYNKVK